MVLHHQNMEDKWINKKMMYNVHLPWSGAALQ